MSRRLRKPRSPQAIAADRTARLAAERARDFAAVGLQPEAARLAANSDIEIRRASARHAEGARRADAFDALRDGMARGAYDAARRLQADMAVRRGEHASGGRTLMRIDCAGGGAGPDGGAVQRLDRSRGAAARIDAALAKVGARDALLLGELIQPTTSGRTWREIVRAVTGEENPVAQGAVVRAACANLAMAYGG
jgi:hypothetical protein